MKQNFSLFVDVLFIILLCRSLVQKRHIEKGYKDMNTFSLDCMPFYSQRDEHKDNEKKEKNHIKSFFMNGKCRNFPLIF